MPKVGDVVRYSAFGRAVNALVLAVTTGDLSHQGANSEPMLDLAYIDPLRESAIEKKQIGWHPRVFVEYSVVHASHTFSSEYKRDKGITTPAQMAAQRGQGEWMEIVPIEPPLVDHSMCEQAFDRLLADNTKLRSVLAAEVLKRGEPEPHTEPGSPDLPEISPKVDDVVFAGDNPNVVPIGEQSSDNPPPQE